MTWNMGGGGIRAVLCVVFESAPNCAIACMHRRHWCSGRVRPPPTHTRTHAPVHTVKVEHDSVPAHGHSKEQEGARPHKGRRQGVHALQVCSGVHGVTVPAHQPNNNQWQPKPTTTSGTPTQTNPRTTSGSPTQTKPCHAMPCHAMPRKVLVHMHMS